MKPLAYMSHVDVGACVCLPVWVHLQESGGVPIYTEPPLYDELVAMVERVANAGIGGYGQMIGGPSRSEAEELLERIRKGRP